MKRFIKFTTMLMVLVFILPIVVNAGEELDNPYLSSEEIRMQREDEIEKENAKVFDFEKYDRQQENSISTFADNVSTMKNSPISRISGSNRIRTAIEISKSTYSKSDNLILTGYSASADALSGTILTDKVNAPMLIVSKTLDKDVKMEIKRLAAKKVYILGGQNAVSLGVENSLVDMGLKVIRISGENRFTTSVNIADMSSQKEKVFLARGMHRLLDGKEDALADALSVGSVSAKKNMPILLTLGDKLPSVTKSFLKENVSQVTIIGGINAISANIENEIRKMGIKIDRVTGSNRYETSVAVANKFTPKSSKIVVASGISDSDALVSGYYANKKNASTVLTTTDSLNIATQDYIESSPKEVVVIGGDSVVTKKVFNQLRDSIRDKPLICIDYGHGGYDSGATYLGRLEKNETYRLGKLVTKKLRAKGILVDETRKHDETLNLRERSTFTNKKKYDYVVSIHRNAYQPQKACGVETFVHPQSSNASVELARVVQNNLLKVGFLDRKVKTANFHMLREVNPPSILIEVGFIDHDIDNGIFDRKKEEIADEIVNGILSQLDW